MWVKNEKSSIKKNRKTFESKETIIHIHLSSTSLVSSQTKTKAIRQVAFNFMIPRFQVKGRIRIHYNQKTLGNLWISPISASYVVKMEAAATAALKNSTK